MYHIKEQIAILVLNLSIQKMESLKNDLKIDRSDNTQICFNDLKKEDRELIYTLMEFLGIDRWTVDSLEAVDNDNYVI